MADMPPSSVHLTGDTILVADNLANQSHKIAKYASIHRRLGILQDARLDGWREVTENRFVGNTQAYWHKAGQASYAQSKCVCRAEDGCVEAYHNRVMRYECYDMNCNAGKMYCQNWAFQSLVQTNVEVIKTPDRGYGVRSNQCFEPGQLILQCTGEVVTRAECDRRMKQEYKNAQCYYFMAFDQNLIIDATNGNIARFVNHSCDPNFRMEKWIVHGLPTIGLFAGNNRIMAGDKLTFDYDFGPFSTRTQKCLYGSANCHGVLGPRLSKSSKSETKAVEATAENDRKRKEALNYEKAAISSSKKRTRKVMSGMRSRNTYTTGAFKTTANRISVAAKVPTSAFRSKKLSVSDTLDAFPRSIITRSKAKASRKMADDAFACSAEPVMKHCWKRLEESI